MGEVVSEPKILGPLPLMVGVVEVEKDYGFLEYPVLLVGERVVWRSNCAIDPYQRTALAQAVAQVADMLEQKVDGD